MKKPAVEECGGERRRSRVVVAAQTLCKHVQILPLITKQLNNLEPNKKSQVFFVLFLVTRLNAVASCCSCAFSSSSRQLNVVQIVHVEHPSPPRSPLSLLPPGVAFKHLVQRAIHRPLVRFPITSTFFSFICRFFFPILQFPVLGLNYILCRFPAFDFWTETQGSTRNHQPDLVRASPRWQTLLRSLSFLWFL